jgi:hypothetical protein
LVALDLGEVPLPVVGRLPFTTWRRLHRVIEGSETVCVVVASEPLARSAAGITLALAPAAAAMSEHECGERSGALGSPRAKPPGGVPSAAAAVGCLAAMLCPIGGCSRSSRLKDAPCTREACGRSTLCCRESSSQRLRWARHDTRR